MHSRLTDHRRGAPGCTATSYLLTMLAGSSVPGTGTVHFARAIKGLRVKVYKWGCVDCCPWMGVPCREHVCLYG